MKEVLQQLCSPVQPEFNFEENSIGFYIEKDDSEYIKKYFAEEIEEIQIRKKHMLSPIKLSALCGSINCFKYFVNNEKIAQNIAKYAIEGGEISICELCHFKGVDFSKLVDFAIEKRQNHILSWILQNYVEHQHVSIYTAAKYGNNDCVVYCLNKGVNANTPDKKIIHCFMVTQLYTLLLQMRRVDGVQPIHLAAQNNETNVISFLLENRIDINSTAKNGATALHFAVENSCIETVQLLLSKGINIDAVKTNGFSALHCSCKAGNKCITKLLLQSSADYNLEENSGFAPIHLAAQIGNYDIVQQLVFKGCNYKRFKKTNISPLHLACSSGSADIVDFLVHIGIDPNCTDNEMNTPLHYAAQSGSLEIIKFLVKSGADIMKKNWMGLIPYHVANNYCKKDVSTYLMQLRSETRTKVPITRPGTSYHNVKSSKVGYKNKNLVQEARRTSSVIRVR